MAEINDIKICQMPESTSVPKYTDLFVIDQKKDGSSSETPYNTVSLNGLQVKQFIFDTTSTSLDKNNLEFTCKKITTGIDATGNRSGGAADQVLVRTQLNTDSSTKAANTQFVSNYWSDRKANDTATISKIWTFSSGIKAGNLDNSRVVVSDTTKKLVSSGITTTELNYLDNARSNIQSQLDTKAPSANPRFSGSITTPLSENHAVITNGDKQLVASTITSDELFTLSGIRGNIQEQLDEKGAGDNVVHKTEDEVITGLKHMKELRKYSSGITKGTKPATDASDEISFTDKNSKGSAIDATRLGSVRNTVTTGGAVRTSIVAYRNSTSSTESTDSAELYVENANGTHNAYAPVPEADSSTSDSSNKIATVCWVNNPSKSLNVVHRSGNETISGLKTFKDSGIEVLDGDVRIKSSNFNSTGTTTDTVSKISLIDNRNTNAGYISFGGTKSSRGMELCTTDTNGNYKSGLSFKTDASSNSKVCLKLGNLDRTSFPTTVDESSYDYMVVSDKNGTNIGGFGTLSTSGGYWGNEMFCTRNDTSVDKIGVYSNGTDICTYTPTPAMTSDDKNIVNTEWLRMVVPELIEGIIGPLIGRPYIVESYYNSENGNWYREYSDSTVEFGGYVDNSESYGSVYSASTYFSSFKPGLSLHPKYNITTSYGRPRTDSVYKTSLFIRWENAETSPTYHQSEFRVIGKKYNGSVLYKYFSESQSGTITLPAGKYKISMGGGKGGTAIAVTSYGNAIAHGGNGGFVRGLLTLTEQTDISYSVGKNASEKRAVSSYVKGNSGIETSINGLIAKAGTGGIADVVNGSCRGSAGGTSTKNPTHGTFAVETETTGGSSTPYIEIITYVE